MATPCTEPGQPPEGLPGFDPLVASDITPDGQYIAGDLSGRLTASVATTMYLSPGSTSATQEEQPRSGKALQLIQ